MINYELLNSKEMKNRKQLLTLQGRDWDASSIDIHQCVYMWLLQGHLRVCMMKTLYFLLWNLHPLQRQ